MKYSGIVVAAFLLSGLSVAAIAAPLPEPLTLDEALKLVDEAHPDILVSRSHVDSARAGVEHARSRSGIKASVQAQARWLSPPSTLEAMGSEDHRAVLSLSRSIYDFGRTGYGVDAANAGVKASSLLLEQVKLQRRYDIMAAYFDVILSDIQFSRDNEEMAIGFIRYDRVRERQELGQFSDIDVLEAEADYQRTRRQRYVSESNQRATRTRLSLTLNRPAEIPSRVVPPAIEINKTKLPDAADIQQLVEQHNLELQAIAQHIEAINFRLKSTFSEYLPSVEAEVTTGVYSREIGANDNWRAGVNVLVPLYQGGRVSSKKAQLLAEKQRLQAQLLQRQRELKQQALEGWISYNNLGVKAEEMDVKRDYRELYLDRARALYEMEVKTDLGDSMVQLTQASYNWASVNFERTLVLEKLNILTAGKLKESLK